MGVGNGGVRLRRAAVDLPWATLAVIDTLAAASRRSIFQYWLQLVAPTASIQWLHTSLCCSPGRLGKSGRLNAAAPEALKLSKLLAHPTYLGT